MSHRRRFLRPRSALSSPRRRGRLLCESLETRRLLATLTVGAGGGFDYALIQQAVNHASPGDTIQVANGNYNESVNLSNMGSAIGGQPGDLSIVGASTLATIRSPGGSAIFNSSPLTADISLEQLTLRAPVATAGEDSGLNITGLTGQLSLANLTIDEAMDHGISLVDLQGGFVFEIVDVLDTGSGPNSRGIELIDIDGQGALLNVSVLNVQDTGLYIENNGNREFALSLLSPTIAGEFLSDEPTTDDGIVIELNDAAVLDFVMVGGSLEEMDGAAMAVDVHQDAQMRLRLDTNYLFDNLFQDMMVFHADGNASLTLNMLKNDISTFDGVGRSGLVISADDNATVDAFMEGDAFRFIGDTASVQGVFVSTGNNASAKVNLSLTEVSFSDISGNALHIQGGGDSTMNVVLTDNEFFGVNTVGGAAALLIDQGEANDTVTINMDIRGNTLTEFDPGAADSIRIRQRGSSQFNLEGTAADAQTQLEDTNEADNPIAVIGAVNMIAEGTIVNSFPVALGGAAWEDADENGIFNNGEFGVPNVVLSLTGTELATGNAVNRTTSTDYDGVYQFAGLLPGSYTVTAQTPPGYLITARNQGSDDTVDSDFNPSTKQAIFNLQAGVDHLDLDLGLIPQQPLTLGDLVWSDNNGNGIFDSGEPGVGGVKITLTGMEQGTGASINRTMTTGSDGSYQFSELFPGTYTLAIVLPAGKVLTQQNVGGNEAVDSDFNPATLQAQVTLVADTDNLDVDAGLLDGNFAYWQNPRDRFDVNDDGNVFPIDALQVINALNDGGSRALPVPPVPPNTPPPYVDVTGDNSLFPIDALQVINRLNNVPGTEGESPALLPVARKASDQGEGEDQREEESARPIAPASVDPPPSLARENLISSRSSHSAEDAEELESLIDLLANSRF